MTNTLKLLKYFVPAVLVLVGITFWASQVHANPLRFPTQVASAVATTTRTFLTTAGATSTLVTYDSYSNNGVSGGGSTQALDKATFLVQLEASSTASILNIAVQHSMDGIDWYDDETATPASPAYISVTNPIVYTWTAASVATTSKAIAIPAPLRYVRVQAKITGAAGAIWGAIQPQKQNN